LKTCKKEGCSYPVFGKGFCRNHQYLREDYKPYKYNKKPTGEKDVFLEIWEERERVSFVTGVELSQYEETDLFPNLFAHVLSKKQYPKFRLNKKNIVLLTPDEHYLYDQGTIADRQVYANTCAPYKCDWIKLLTLQIELKLEYGKN
jgi:hypothetical protein